jgi:predicted DsbA family dithiol-disulfide isomerase
MSTIEVFADVRCPFTHVGLRRLLERRAERGHTDVAIRVRAWPLELVNDEPLDPIMIGEEIAALRAQVAPDLFNGFDPNHFAATSIPALMLAAAGYEHSLAAGEQISLALRDALFERGADISDPDVVARLAAATGIDVPLASMRAQILADWHEGQRRGVIGSPHFFRGDKGVFCPSLDISHTQGQLRITGDPVVFDALLDRRSDA